MIKSKILKIPIKVREKRLVLLVIGLLYTKPFSMTINFFSVYFLKLPINYTYIFLSHTQKH
ncbi:hypothetical protein FM106_08045 [Brachybacterium faecium]|nr:hypothetical protein FM106_08045 [Brachybacterium faecium]